MTAARPNGAGEQPCATGKLLAISDLHVAYEDNRAVVAALKPEDPADWLLVAGDVGEQVADIPPGELRQILPGGAAA